MKHVVDKDQVAHLWATQAQSDARNAGGNFYFHGDTIYSYGDHFPIARLVDTEEGQVVLFTTRSCSVTTSGHKYRVLGALSQSQQNRIIRVLSPSSTDRGNFDDARNAYVEKLREADKSRSRKAALMREAEHIRQQANRYRALFCRRLKDIPQAADYAEAYKAARQAELVATRQLRARRATREAAEQARRTEELKQWATVGLPLWKSGKNEYPDGKHLRPPYFAPIDFRVEAEEVVTTKGARFPVDHCRRVFGAIAKVRKSGQEWHRNGQQVRVGLFQIDSIDAEGNVTAGCHNVRWDEIQAFAKDLGIVK